MRATVAFVFRSVTIQPPPGGGRFSRPTGSTGYGTAILRPGWHKGHTIASGTSEKNWLGSDFAGLSGAVLTSACLAHLGGGAIAFGGLGMAGGTIAIVGGGAILGLGVGAGVGGAVGAAGVLEKKNTILQSAKLMVSVREIFLNDEHDLAYSNTVYEQYVQNIMEIEKGLVELRVQLDVASGKDKKLLKSKIKKCGAISNDRGSGNDLLAALENMSWKRTQT